MSLNPYLEDLETRLDPDVEDELLAKWRTFADGNFLGKIFSPHRAKATPAMIEWPRVLVNDALEDIELMILQQLSTCSAAVADGSGALLTVRANYGTCILPSLFGAEVFYMDHEMDTLPTSKPIPGGATAMLGLVERGMPNLESGCGSRVFAATHRFLEVLAPFPKLSRFIHIYHPDTQGPMDIAELLWGSTIFVDAIDQPELVHALLDLISTTYTGFLRAWYGQVPAEFDYAFHWRMLHRGRIMLRDDSAMNFSPRMFEEFILLYDQRLLDEFDGGAIHACGKVDHYIRYIGEMRDVYAFNMSQPEYNDMEMVYRHTIDKGIPLIGLQREIAENALASGRDLHSLVHCT